MPQEKRDLGYTFGFIQGGIAGMAIALSWRIFERWENEPSLLHYGYRILIGLGAGLLILAILYPWKKMRERRLQQIG